MLFLGAGRGEKGRIQAKVFLSGGSKGRYIPPAEWGRFEMLLREILKS